MVKKKKVRINVDKDLILEFKNVFPNRAYSDVVRFTWMGWKGFLNDKKKRK